MVGTGSGWHVLRTAPSLNTAFYLRTQGQVSTGGNTSSSSLIETTQQFYLTRHEGIFIDGFD